MLQQGGAEISERKSITTEALPSCKGFGTQEDALAKYRAQEAPRCIGGPPGSKCSLGSREFARVRESSREFA
jgi:hypothetical protein